METFVMGDIHGAYKAMQQCLERSGFDYEKDRLIQLGDITDGFDEVYACVEELLKIKNLVALKGNHDDWFAEFLRTGYHPQNWAQGGLSTAISYLRLTQREYNIFPRGTGWQTLFSPMDVPLTHRQFFQNQSLYFIDEENNCFVHGGFIRLLPFEEQEPSIYYWDRSLWYAALSYKETRMYETGKGSFRIATPFNHIFIGHTPTIAWKTDQPIKAANIYNIDTGAGHNGRLTIMHVKSKQYWQSDAVTTLYDTNYR